MTYEEVVEKICDKSGEPMMKPEEFFMFIEDIVITCGQAVAENKELLDENQKLRFMLAKLKGDI